MRRVWVVVVAKKWQERRVERELQQQGFETYLPLRLSRNVRTGALSPVPFIAPYLFCRVSLDIGEWKRVWYTFGVQGVLGTAECPLGVKDELVERIRMQEEAGFIKVGLDAQGPRFDRGQRVRVDELGIEAIFMERIDARRGLVLLSLLGRESRCTIDLRKLRSTEET